MPQVSVIIDGKSYRMACDPGQEDHLSELAARLDRYVAHLKSSFGEIGDLRVTVMAGIMILDELDQAQKRAGELEAERDEAVTAREAALAKADRAGDVLAERLGLVAEKIETITGKIA
ncbi:MULTISPECIES: cell division protein ZapA [unclassified Roseitalea]|uniref:cell division protein ZapA n=1 Tax=unclassified Roseitalea TaxID=2639107 RepID=UPI00273ED212|nr:MULTISPECIES: cell division protein ZapA [unclassified Roseitalea]